MEKQEQKKVSENDPKIKSAEFDKLSAEADAERKDKKPGSQSNHSKQHNNGRGGGK